MLSLLQRNHDIHELSEHAPCLMNLLANTISLSCLSLPRLSRAPPNHQRALAGLLMQIADVIARYETWTNDPLEEHLTFAERPDDLTDIERDALHDLAHELVRETNRLAATFGLKPHGSSMRASLAGAFTILWSDIEDSGPKHLVGYGPVSPEVRAHLEPCITRLARLSLRMSQVASGRAEAAGTDVDESR